MAAPRSEPLSINTQFLGSNFSVGSRFGDLRPIGYGANGLVFSAIDSECDKHVAIKKISFHDQISCKFALREIKIMRGLEHENIVKVYECLGPDGAALETVEPDLHAVYIVQELLDSDLHCLIQSGQLTEAHAQLFLYQLLRGLKYLHSAHVLHRDLKPNNLLVNLDDLTLKITDFGLARILDPNYNHKGFLTENLGTTWYKSPENVITPKDYDSSVDMWSAGCVFGEMLLGRALFPGAHELNQLHLILDSIELEESDWNHVMRFLPNKLLKNHPLQTRTPLRERMPDVDPLAMDLLERLLRFNPADRLTAEEALTHPYFTDLHSANDEPVVVESFSIEHEVDDLSPTCLKELIVSEVTQLTVTCGQKICPEAALPSKIVNKNLRNQLIHNKVTLDRCKVNTDVSGIPIITQSKTPEYTLSGAKNPECTVTPDGGAKMPEHTQTQESGAKTPGYTLTPESDAKTRECTLMPETGAKTPEYTLGPENGTENIPTKVEFTRGISSSSSSRGIEEVYSDDASSDCEKESYQSMLEHLNKLNMAKSLVESPKKKKKEAILKKEVEKGYDDEKDTAEYSTRKYEEDQELNIMKIKYDNECAEMFGLNENCDIYQIDGSGDAHISQKPSAEPTGMLIEDFMFPRTNTVIDLKLKHQSEQNKDPGENYSSRMKQLNFDALMNNSDDSDENTADLYFKKSIYDQEIFPDKSFESLCIDTNEIENFKEFSQPSPKENSDEEFESGHNSIWTNFENAIGFDSIMNAQNQESPDEIPIIEESADLEESNKFVDQTVNYAEDESFDLDTNGNLETLRNFAQSRDSDLDSNLSSDSNKHFEEAQNLGISTSFSSTEKLKELCDSENERCRTPSEQIPDKDTIKRKLNALNQKKLKDMANIGVPTIEEDSEVIDKNDKNRLSLQAQGCRPKVFSNNDSSALSQGTSGENVPNLLPRPKTQRIKSINLHKLRQEINERLKQEEVQARTGDLAAGGGWNSSSVEAQNYAAANHREDLRYLPGSTNRPNSLNSEVRSMPNEYALPQPRWPCGEVNPPTNQNIPGDRNHSNNNNRVPSNNINNSNNMLNNRRGSGRASRRKFPRKTKAL